MEKQLKSRKERKNNLGWQAEYGILSGARENKRKKETAEQFGAYLYIPFLTDNIPDPVWLHSHPNKWRRLSVYEAILL